MNTSCDSLSFRSLVHADEPAVEAFLAARSDTTMILRSNLRRAGLAYAGATFQGLYTGAFAGDALVGVVAHYWNDNLVLAGGDHVVPLVERSVASSRRPVAGILGTHAEVAAARRALRGSVGTPQHEGKEILFAVDLANLVVPGGLARLSARTPNDAELPMLLEWRMAYAAATTGAIDTPETRRRQAEMLRAFHASHDDVLLFDGGRPVSYAAFNATVSAGPAGTNEPRVEIVQVGGVWTPPELRGRGYARCAVAASLLEKRARGARRAILFTHEDNAPAQRSYRALGFRAVGDYAIVVYG